MDVDRRLIETASYCSVLTAEFGCLRPLGKVHADDAKVNVNVWLAPDSANLGSAQTGDEGGLTVFHAQPPGEREDDHRNQRVYFPSTGFDTN